ncbi:2-amino-4-hydroxy-6-hydroxymethyldihydropteridine diphosphokinase [Tsuneonella suprasediminis]|uniref:2-amino-4-hydroxy-6-hydroxymethyldihydropteridine pyrophosphokinase n=1 Tax=Tsuneonella suprasediminis TaxID=2306996 RepID=A0A419R5F1_9SPHN|nr:2-amino-4-hydroxy-6-hydroxymethyldihydropteridine diphosphokinase [Tsuneonella suprasediminis]RJX71112.1 2-amino-4-hydroxy-6-hydroxymethyldihydropteridine diphosphokinase [Tsuneonella suprasediminis]
MRQLGHCYIVALGSNVRHIRHGSPRKVLSAAIAAMQDTGLELQAIAPIMESAPLGPSRRRYANTAAMIATNLGPEALLATLQAIEAAFGRKRTGQPWSARVLDLDILLWSGGTWFSPNLTIPHPLFRQRTFALAPAATIAPDWRDPISGYTLRQLLHRLTHTVTLLVPPAWSGP